MELFNNFKSLFLTVWDRGILGVDIFQILIGIGIFLIFLILRGIISKVIIKRLENFAKKTTNKLDDAFVQAMVGPARFLPIVIGFFIASYYMSFSEDSRAIVDTINRTLITIFIFWLIHQKILNLNIPFGQQDSKKVPFEKTHVHNHFLYYHGKEP